MPARTPIMRRCFPLELRWQHRMEPACLARVAEDNGRMGDGSRAIPIRDRNVTVLRRCFDPAMNLGKLRQLDRRPDGRGAEGR